MAIINKENSTEQGKLSNAVRDALVQARQYADVDPRSAANRANLEDLQRMGAVNKGKK